MVKILSVAGITCVFMLAGCAVKAPRPEPAQSAVSFVDEKIRDAAESISKDMSQLSGSSQNRNAGLTGSGDLYTHMDLVWDGPIDDALRKIASTAGYQFRVEGKAHQDPVNVHLRLVDRPCLLALREIGLQTGAREGIIVNEAGRMITLKYIGSPE